MGPEPSFEDDEDDEVLDEVVLDEVVLDEDLISVSSDPEEDYGSEQVEENSAEIDDPEVTDPEPLSASPWPDNSPTSYNQNWPELLEKWRQQGYPPVLAKFDGDRLVRQREVRADPWAGKSFFRDIRLAEHQIGKPVDIFMQFLPEEIACQFADWTNQRLKKRIRDAVRRGKTPPLSTNAQWHLKPAEIYVFFALLTHFSVFNLHNVKDYWQTDTNYPQHHCRRWMSRDRFLFIYRWLTTWDPNTPSPDGGKPGLWERFDYFSNHLQLVSQRLLRPGFFLSIDETMVRFQGRNSSKTTVPSKPIPTGFKLYPIAEAGYFLAWVPHTSAGVRLPPRETFLPAAAAQDKKLTETQALVLYLCTRLSPLPAPLEHRHLIVDNYFTSNRAFRYLLDLNWVATGTAAVNRAGKVDLKRGRSDGILPSILKVKQLTNTQLKGVPWGTTFAELSPDGKVSNLVLPDPYFHTASD